MASARFCLEHFIFVRSKLTISYSPAIVVNVYLCSLWVKYRTLSFQNVTVSYTNAYRILHTLSMRFSARLTFVDSCNTRIRECIYSLMSRLSISANLIVQCSLNSDVYTTSALLRTWISALYNIS